MATVNKDFKIKSGLIVEGPNGTINGSDIITEDAITGGTQTNVTVTYDAQNKVVNFVAENGVADSTTDDLAEGSTNLYFTDARAKDSAAALLTTATLTNISITGTGNGGLTITAENGVADSTTDDLDEGSTNLYFTDERAQDAVGNAVGNGIEYNDASGAIAVKIANNGGALEFDGSGYLKVNSDANTSDGMFGTGTLTTQGSANELKVNTNVIASKAHVDSLIGDATVDGTAGNTVTDRIATAVADLVDGAPALLDTLNELAAAINDDASFATTVTNQIATKQDTLTAGNAIFIDGTTDTISVTYDAGLELDGNGKLVVDTDTIASVSYVDNNFVNVADLPGQLDDYVPLTDKGAANGVATLDANGQVPLNQLGNVPVDYITSVGDNLSVTGGELNIATTPTFTAVDINSVAKQVAATSTSAAAGDVIAYSFDATAFRSAKFLVKVAYGTHTQLSEILLTLDTSDNIAITEYAIIGTNGSLGDVSATFAAGVVNLTVTVANSGVNIAVMGTLLA